MGICDCDDGLGISLCNYEVAMDSSVARIVVLILAVIAGAYAIDVYIHSEEARKRDEYAERVFSMAERFFSGWEKITDRLSGPLIPRRDHERK